jgi:predicted XRE-type DNA-binding protein
MRAFKLGAVKFRSRSAAAKYLLRNSHLSQTEIAKRVHVSIPCVNQLANA